MASPQGWYLLMDWASPLIADRGLILQNKATVPGPDAPGLRSAE